MTDSREARQIGRWTARQTDRQADRQVARQAATLTVGQIDRQTDRQTEGRTDRRADKIKRLGKDWDWKHSNSSFAWPGIFLDRIFSQFDSKVQLLERMFGKLFD